MFGIIPVDFIFVEVGHLQIKLARLIGGSVAPLLPTSFCSHLWDEIGWGLKALCIQLIQLRLSRTLRKGRIRARKPCWEWRLKIHKPNEI